MSAADVRRSGGWLEHLPPDLRSSLTATPVVLCFMLIHVLTACSSLPIEKGAVGSSESAMFTGSGKPSTTLDSTTSKLLSFDDLTTLERGLTRSGTEVLAECLAGRGMGEVAVAMRRGAAAQDEAYRNPAHIAQLELGPENLTDARRFGFLGAPSLHKAKYTVSFDPESPAFTSAVQGCEESTPILGEIGRRAGNIAAFLNVQRSQALTRIEPTAREMAKRQVLCVQRTYKQIRVSDALTSTANMLRQLDIAAGAWKHARTTRVRLNGVGTVEARGGLMYQPSKGEQQLARRWVVCLRESKYSVTVRSTFSQAIRRLEEENQQRIGELPQGEPLANHSSA